MSITSFSELHSRARQSGPVRVAIAGGADDQVAEALSLGIEAGLILHATVTGDRAGILRRLPPAARHAITCLHAETPAEMAALAVAEIAAGRADIVIKGMVDSGSYLRAVMHRDTGIAVAPLLSNITIAEMPGLDRLIAATDNGIVPAPTLDQKRQIIANTAPLWRGLGVNAPRVALIAASEKPTPAMPATIEAAELAAAGLQGFRLSGPMGYDMAVNPRAAALKGAADAVAGHADLLLFPNIESANAVVKSWKFHGQARTGSVVMGGRAPILLNSRSDGAMARLNGLLLAMVQVNGPVPA